MRILVLIFLLLRVVESNAKFDASLTTAARTFPIGASLDIEAGFQYRFWQRDDTYKYGYLRPAVALSTLGSWNLLEGRFEFAPIRFFRLAYVGQYERSSVESNYINCGNLSCLALLHNQAFEARLELEFKSVFGRLTAKTGTYWQDSLKPRASSLQHEVSVGNAEAFQSHELMLGYKLIDEVSLLAHLSRISTAANVNAYQHAYLGFLYRHGGRALYLALGAVDSELVGKNPSLLLRYYTELL